MSATVALITNTQRMLIEAQGDLLTLGYQIETGAWRDGDATTAILRVHGKLTNAIALLTESLVPEGQRPPLQ